MSLIRLNKYIAECGVASRRKADQLIENGSVKINGKTTYELGVKVDPKNDRITVKGKPLAATEQKEYYILNKPKYVLTTVNDPEGRPTVMDVFSKNKKRLFPVGRLDWETEGLIIITNDGEYSNLLMNPKSKIPKTYEVKLDGIPSQDQLNKLLKGVTIERGGRVKATAIQKLPKKSELYDWIRITIEEGKNRQIRKMFAKIGFDVKKLKRISIGYLKLGKLRIGEFKKMTLKDIEKSLMEGKQPTFSRRNSKVTKKKRKTSTKRLPPAKKISKKKKKTSRKS